MQDLTLLVQLTSGFRLFFGDTSFAKDLAQALVGTGKPLVSTVRTGPYTAVRSLGKHPDKSNLIEVGLRKRTT